MTEDRKGLDRAKDAILDTDPDECEVTHPHHPELRCTLPAGHGPFDLYGQAWDHASLRDSVHRAWKEHR